MKAKVKESWPWGIVQAFAGRQYVKYEWRPVPAGAEAEAERLAGRGLLDLNEAVVLVDATDAALKLASDYGVDLAAVHGSGADGRILLSDVRALVQAGEEE
jgi:pyruvate/2-oxoglutarate dehydrogenase complex dihydrolipoamide acyltransferase (E2) component